MSDKKTITVDIISGKLLSFQYKLKSQFSAACQLVFIISIAVLLFISNNVLAKEKKKPAITDLRVLVDISGSMKKTDPDNLRRPAIRLLAGLIPAGSKAGIWNFGKQVNMTVKIGTINNAWRELAREQSKKISSVGLYTNIESALRKVSFDWKKPDPRFKRNLIILTDGHVDVSKDDDLDKASRKRILKELLPDLEKAKVRIHTIALSDDVDESLLSTLSAYSDGLYKKVSSADELQKIFLQMLEQSVELDTIPINENRFNVDASINDMTLLIFNNKTKPTKIVTPGKKTWDKNANVDTVKWYSDDGYDLITIKKPQQGQWKILAPVDKNNRVVVATNLKLKVNDLPSYIMFGDHVKVDAQLQQEGKKLTDKRLLTKFNFTIKRSINGQGEWLYEMSQPEGSENSSTYQLPIIDKEGISQLIIKAKSPTAEREIRHQFKVYSTPAEIKITEIDGKYEIKATPYTNLLRPDSVKASITLNDKSEHALLRYGNDWVFNVDKKYHKTKFTLNLSALRADGKPISVSFDKIIAGHDSAEKLTLPVNTHKNEKSTVNKPKVKENKPHTKKTTDKNKKKQKIDEHTQKAEEHKEKEEGDINWTIIILSIAIGNILIIVLLGGGYIYMKRRKARLTKNLEDEMTEDEKIEASNKKSDNG